MNVFQYNSTSINYYTTQDLGSIADAPASTVDNGTVYSELELDTDYIVENDYIISPFNTENYDQIVYTDTAYPFGSIKVISSTTSSASVKFVAKVQIKLDGSYQVKVRKYWVGSGSLFEIAGGQERIVAPWVGSSGPLRVSGSATSSALYQYNNSAIAVYSENDFGSVFATSTTSSNYGAIVTTASAEEDFGAIVTTEITYPYGLFKASGYFSDLTRAFGHQTEGGISVSGSAATSLAEPTPQIYEIETTDLFKIYNTPRYNFVRTSYITSGILEIVGDRIERASYEYNELSIQYYNILDNGDFNTPSGTTNYGSVVSGVTQEINYGLTLTTQTTYPYGSFGIGGGFTNLLIGFGYKTEGIITVSGSATTSLVEPTPQVYKIESTDLFKTSGSASHSFSKAPYNGSGLFYNSNAGVSSATYDYNESSVFLYTENDYGGFTSPVSYENYGSVTEPATGDVNYATINFSQTEIPFGKFNLTGGAREEFTYGTFNGSGKLLAFRGASETSAIDYESTYLFNIKGTGNNSFARPFIGSGSLFHIGERVERTTYAYNASAIVEYNSYDYGLVTASGITIDYGNIAQIVSDGEISYGLINIGLTEYATNPIFNFGGQAYTELKPSFNWKGRGGLLFHHQPAPTDTRFIPWWRGYGEVIISNSVIPDAFSRPYIGKGNLFSIGDRIESRTYDYNSSSIEFFTAEDRGLITSSGLTVDYGYVTEPNVGVTDYSSIVLLDVDYPLNVLYTFSGEGVGQFIRGPYTGRGRIEFSGYHSIRQSDAWDGSIVYNISGSSVEKNTERYIGKGNLFSIGDKVESRTYDYNSSSVEFFSAEDYGTITSSGATADYGYVIEPNVGVTDYNSIVILDIEYPLNLLYTFSGEGIGQFIRGPYTGRGQINIDGSLVERQSDAWLGELKISVSGTATEKNSESYVGSGSLFHIGERIEKASYSYNSSSVSIYDATDYGLITTSGNTIDYGYTTEVSAGGEIDYGNVIDLDITYPYGLFSLSGQSSDRWIQVFTKVGSGSLFEFNGATESFSAQTPENTFLYNITGNSADSKTQVFAGFGSLFSVGDRVERATYSYNESSIVVYGLDIDHGLITVSGTTVDYGYVSQIASQGEIDYGSIIISDYDYPVNVLFNFAGESITELKPSFNWKGSGGFRFHHQPLGSDIRFRPWWRSVGGLEIYGDVSDSKTNRYIGEGNLFSFGDKVESRTYDYNSSSVEFFSAEDYGLITASGVIVDYGYVTEPNVGVTDYNSIVILDIEYPLNVLYRFAGESKSQFILGPYTGRGQINLDGSLVERQSDAWLGISNINISGDGLENRIKSYVGTGSLFHIGDRVEKATYSYNSSSVSGYDETDYGFITASGTNIDLGYVNQTSDSGEIDYGNVIDLDITYPYGLFKIAGQSSDRWIQVFTKVGSGSLFEFNGATESFSAQTPENTFLYNVSGNANDSKGRTFVGSGSLFHIGDRIERATFSYNTSSVIDPVIQSDYGDLSGATQNIDYGLITNIADGGEIDYESVIITVGEERPFGLFKVGGIGNTPFDRFYKGTGSLFEFNGATEAFSAQTPENTFLYTFSGSAGTPRTRPFIASGSASFSGYITEKHTEAYQGTGSLAFEERFPAASIANTESYDGSGNITLSTGKFPEFLNYRPTPRYVITSGDAVIYGDGITKPIAVFTKVGSGSLFATGTKVERKADAWVGSGGIDVSGIADADRTRSYAGTGFFSILKGSAESFSAQTPESTVLYTFSGSAAEKNTERFIGSGTLFSAGSGTETILISAPTPTGLYSISGSAVPVITLSHFGSGSLFAYSESSSSVTFNPVENTVLYEVSGNGSVRRTDSYVGVGRLHVDGTAIEKNVEDYDGSGNLFSVGVSESYVVFNPSENTILFRIFGSAIEKNVENYIGSGDLSIIGDSTSRVVFNPVEQTAEYVISGAVSEQLIKSYLGLGSLFTFSGASESISYNPTESTVLYNISGSATVKNTERYIGSIDINVSGNATEKHVENYVGSGDIAITGTSTEKHVENYVGSGVINISGTKEIAFSKAPYIGSGSLVTFKGASESFVANVPEETILFSFTGNANEKHTEKYVGRGAETISGSAKERHTESYSGRGTETISGSARIFFVAQTPENTILFRFTGDSKFKFISRYQGSGTERIFGYITEKQTDSYKGSGTLFGIGNTSYNRVITQRTDSKTSLFRVLGSSPNNYSRISVTNKFNINISGESKDTVILFSPARIFGTII